MERKSTYCNQGSGRIRNKALCRFLVCMHLPDFKIVQIIDIGTGAGFPLLICFPEKQFVLVDSLNKRIRILQEVIENLNIRNAVAIHGRAEDLAADRIHREQYVCLPGR